MVLPCLESDAGCSGAEDAGWGLLNVNPPIISGIFVLLVRLSLLGVVGVSEITVGKPDCRDGLVLILVGQGLEELEEFVTEPIGTVFPGSDMVL